MGVPAVRATQAAANHWDTWMGAAGFLTVLWMVGRFGGVALLALLAILALHLLLAWFLPVELWAAKKEPRWTLSYRVWDYPVWFRFMAVPWQAGMLAVTIYHSPFWQVIGVDAGSAVVQVTTGLLWAGIGGWLAAHHPGRGEVV